MSIGGVVDPLSDFGIADVSGVAGALLLGGGVIGVVEGAGEVIVGGVVGGSAGVGDLLHATSVAQAATSNACETFMRNLIYRWIGTIAETQSLRRCGAVPHRTRAQHAVGRVLTARAAFASMREKSRHRRGRSSRGGASTC